MHRVVLALLVIGCAVPMYADNWPNWGGSSSTGVPSETDLPVRWSDTENIALESVDSRAWNFLTDGALYAIGK